MWQLINKEAGNFPSYDQNIQLKTETGTTTNLRKVTELLNSYFVETVDELIQHNTCHINTQILQKKRIDYCPTSIFVVPITDNGVECVTKNLQGKFSAGFNRIPEYVVIQCTSLIRGPSTHIYNISFRSGIFLEKFKILRVKPLYKKRDIHNVKNYCYRFYQSSLKYWKSWCIIG